MDATRGDKEAGFMGDVRRRGGGVPGWAVAVVVAVALIAAFLASVSIGTRSVPLGDVAHALLTGDQSTVGGIVVWRRVPRTAFALLAGAALGVAGLLMQAVTRNPIADPSILGVNTGASLAVVIGIAFLGVTTATQYTALAVAGAALAAAFVYGVGSAGGGGATPLKLALAGTATSLALSSLVSVIMLPRGNVMDTFRFWQVGSVGGADMATAAGFAPLLAVGLIVALVMAPALEVLALGDQAAVGLGARPGVTRLVCSAAAVLLCGGVTALAGPVGFVGLMVPHVVRTLYRGGMRVTVALCALAGGALLLLSDVVGRLLGMALLGTPDLEVGIVTAVVGAPVFIIVAIRSARGGVLEADAR